MNQFAPHTVAIVLDEAFSARLAPLAERAAVWVVDSPANRPAIQSLWTARRTRGATYDVTVFRTIPGLTPEDHIDGVVRSVERHRESDETRATVGAIEVYGAEMSDTIRSAFAGHGYARLEALDDGFRAQRGSGS